MPPKNSKIQKKAIKSSVEIINWCGDIPQRNAG
jgi:hypothetical protein